MRILVVEPNQNHVKTAERDLGGHELTITLSFNEAMLLLRRRIDDDKVARVLESRGFPAEPNPITNPIPPNEYHAERGMYCAGRGHCNAFWQALSQARKESVSDFPFDVVLVSSELPADQGSTDDRLGLVMALRAAKGGAKLVVVFTRDKQSNDPIALALESFWAGDHSREAQRGGLSFRINGARVEFVADQPMDALKGRNWKLILKEMLADLEAMNGQCFE